MKIKEVGAISKLRDEFNSIPRDNVIKGMRTRNAFLESVKEAEKESVNELETNEELNNTHMMER